MKVELTREHIETGIPGDCTACPVMIAMNAAGLYPGSVQPDEICWYDDESEDDDREATDTSIELAEWMRRFDSEESCEPITLAVKKDLVSIWTSENADA